MICSIMQPTYLPWSGYFNLITHSDVFIFLDDVQYTKNSFQNRNQYLERGVPKWITVPVFKTSGDKLIKDALINDDDKWRKKHLTLLQNVYNSHLYFKELFPYLRDVIENTEIKTISELNIELILAISQYLNLQTKFFRSSELGIKGQRTERLINICKHFDCDTYLSPKGAKEYIEEDGNFLNSNVNLEFQNFTCSSYKQKNANVDNFVSHMSIIDLIANEGKSSSAQYLLDNFIPISKRAT
ncbi:MAG: WbqC family protein [Bacteriovorax sp.]|nr:WbqC family protein [Bacteriovorax sp.]